MQMLFTTVGTEDDAHHLARTLVQERLCACVQIEALHSIYRWNDEVHAQPEWRLLLKTTATVRPRLQARLLQLHPYSLPVIYTLTPDGVPAALEDWLEAATR